MRYTFHNTNVLYNKINVNVRNYNNDNEIKLLTRRYKLLPGTIKYHVIIKPLGRRISGVRYCKYFVSLNESLTYTYCICKLTLIHKHLGYWYLITPEYCPGYQEVDSEIWYKELIESHYYQTT